MKKHWTKTLAFLDDDTQSLMVDLPDYDLTVRLLLAMLAQANRADSPEHRQPWQLHDDADGGNISQRHGLYTAINHVLDLLGASAVASDCAANGEVSTKPGELEARFCPREPIENVTCPGCGYHRVVAVSKLAEPRWCLCRTQS
tara:strand:+ start:281 stop:712 length:432 start_codon:yes stop_codon:yes gene_type:complete